MQGGSKQFPRTMAAVLTVVIVIVASAAAFVLFVPQGSNSGKLQVVATFYPLYYLSSQVAGDRADVHTLIPDNVEPHSWEPTPSDLIEVSEAQVLVFNGAGFEPWMEDFLAAVNNPSLIIVDTSMGVSLMPSDTVVEAYKEATALLSTGPNYSLTASAATGMASTVECGSEVFLVNMTQLEGGMGGYFALHVSAGGDYRLFVTDDVDFALIYANGTAVGAELENGAMTWYPGFSSSKFYELQGGSTYLVSFAPGQVEATKLVVVQAVGETDEGHDDHDHGPQDPHFWIDPLNAKIQVQNILLAFNQADPGNSTYYTQNAEALLVRLDKLNQDFVDGLANRTKNAIVTTHEGFNYMAFRYGFEAYAAIGISADQQPSPQDMARLASLVNDLDLHYVFSEPTYLDSVMEIIAGETGAHVLILDGLHGRAGVHKGMDYFEIMYANLQNLRIGLEVAQ
jgi:ABC-type Zn uptake system ZnuABC Zn-binding protein ZnuA